MGPGRSEIRSFHLARGLAILFMMMQHCLIIYGSENTQFDSPGLVILLLGTAPAAPIFMFIMGVLFTYTKEDNFEHGLQRGASILLLGYALNLFRLSLPALIGVGSGMASLEDLQGFTPVTLFLMVDILQLAGLALMIMAVVNHSTRDPRLHIALCAVVAGVSPMLWGQETGNLYVDQLLSLFWGNGIEVAFPVFPWLAFPLAGMVMGAKLREGAAVEDMLSRGLRPGVVLLVVGTAVSLTDPAYHFGDYYHSGPGAMMILLGFVYVWLFLCHRWVGRVDGTAAGRVLFFWSRYVTPVYVVQWLIVGWGVLLLGFMVHGLLVVLAAIPVVVALTHLVTLKYADLIEKRPELRPWSRISRLPWYVSLGLTALLIVVATAML